jgi:metal-responsive CopG/Arc/MetJ family transcriptional regulator
MSSSNESVEIEVAFDEGLLERMDRIRLSPGYESRSDVVTAALDAVGE